MEAEAVAARDQYLRMLDRMAASGAEVNVSVKLTQMGLDISEALCVANMTAILEKAAALHGFVRLDMEGSDYTQRTLEFFRRRLFDRFGAHCGVVIQSMLRRSEQDIEDLIAHEGAGAALQGRLPRAAGGRVPRQGRRGPELRAPDGAAAARGQLPGIATHDEAIIAHARDFVRRAGHRQRPVRVPDAVRRAARPPGDASAQAGYRLRVYIPFGTQWYPYLMRRLAERPANIAFILGNIVRESVPGR